MTILIWVLLTIFLLVLGTIFWLVFLMRKYQLKEEKEIEEKVLEKEEKKPIKIKLQVPETLSEKKPSGFVLELPKEKILSEKEAQKIQAEKLEAFFEEFLKELQKEKENFFKKMKESLEKFEKELFDSKKEMEKLKQELKESFSLKMESFLKEVFLEFQKSFEKSFEDLQEELENYKKEKQKEIDQKAIEVLQAFVEKVGAKMIDLSTHEKLIREALEKAKAENLF